MPLTLRQQEIEREIDDLNRRIVLAAMLFILFGAAIGYPMAERIADPVNRLTRATRRIARGDFDARVAATSSDELRRLVDAFNRMSAELLRQRGELERTHRLEAWAEMARQVAHDIKNPLTPIQLSAEHLRRVHADRGKPLGPVLEGCVDSILSQVRLLRQLASEFSSFASSPTARIAPADLAELVDEVVRPYETGGDRWRFVREFAESLPLLKIDRVLVGRALTNVVDNALHAMPGGGTIALRAQPAGRRRGRADHHRHRRGHGRRSDGAALRTLLLHQGGGHRAGAVDRAAERGTQCRHHPGDQRARTGHAGDHHAARRRRGHGPA